MSNYQVGDVYAVRPNPEIHGGGSGWVTDEVTEPALATVIEVRTNGIDCYRVWFNVQGHPGKTTIDPKYLTFVHRPEPKNVNETTYEIQDERGNEIALCRNDVRGTLDKGIYLRLVDDEDYLRGTVIPTANLDLFIEALQSLKNPA